MLSVLCNAATQLKLAVGSCYFTKFELHLHRDTDKKKGSMCCAAAVLLLLLLLCYADRTSAEPDGWVTRKDSSKEYWFSRAKG